jgi:hypothetical protein
MRVMVLVHATGDSERGDYASHADEFVAMGKFNEELVKAGVMLAGEGLAPSSQAKMVEFAADGAGSRVIDGPFAEAKEVIGGFWIWQVSSMEEAVEWVRRAPFRDQQIEVRKILEAADFEGKLPAQVLEDEARLRAQTSSPTEG